MKWEQLTDEEKETVKRMVGFCLNRCYCLGMDEGYKADDTETEERKNLTEFSLT